MKSNGDFPLKETGEIALYGNGVRKTIKGGTGSGEVNSRFFINVEEGFKRAGFTVTSGKWLDAYDERYVQAKADFKKVIKERAKKKHTVAAIEGMGAVMPEPEYSFPLDAKGDTAIYVLARISGEGNDRQIAGGDVLLSATEQRDILTLAEKYDKFMLVMDSVGLGIFTVVGVNTGIRQGYMDNVFLLVFLGTITGVGGGLLRDMMASVPPYIFVKHIYACASIIGAVVCVYMNRFVGNVQAMVVSSIVVVLIRYLAAHYRWNLPRLSPQS